MSNNRPTELPCYRPRNIMARVNRARHFPHNTDPYVRHVQMIGDALLHNRPYPMLQEEPVHCGGSLLITVEHLYKARNELARLKREPWYVELSAIAEAGR